MKDAVIVWTPLHLYNILRYILSNELQGTFDLYYISQSDEMVSYLKNIREQNIFCNIYHTSREIIVRNQLLWERIGVIVSPKLQVRHLFGNDAVDNDYDRLFMSVQTKLNDALFRANNCREVVGYDDGTGSYIRDLYERQPWRNYNFVKTIKKERFIDVKTVFLSCPEFRLKKEKDITYNKLDACPLKPAERQILKSVFGYDDHAIHTSGCIFLNQPLFEAPDPIVHKKEERNLIRVIETERNGDLMVRIHPREIERETYRGLKIDNNKALWELICEYRINPDTVLVSSFSTAQFTPKLYSDKEPILIFTFNLYSDYSVTQKEHFTELIEKLRSIYRDPARIYVPNTIEELIKCIK